MVCKSKKDVLRVVKDKNVSFIQFWFTDVLGILPEKTTQNFENSGFSARCK